MPRHARHHNSGRPAASHAHAYVIFTYFVAAHKVRATQRKVAAMQYTPHGRENRILMAILKEWRLNVGLTQIQLSERSGIRQSDVSRIENGARQIGYFELRDWLCALGFDIATFDAELQSRLLRQGITQPLQPRQVSSAEPQR